jgi:hypothetical protein
MEDNVKIVNTTVKITLAELLMMEHDFIRKEMERIEEEAKSTSCVSDYSYDFMNFVRAINGFANELIGEDA